MYAKFCVNRETANNFMRLFVNRRAYAIQAERPLANGSVPYYPARDWKTKEPKPLDEGVVRMHLNGDITISLYAINPETPRSKWVAIDADFDGSLESLFQLQRELKQDGVDAALEQSRRGGHLWIFGAEPLLASECRIYVYNLALRLGIPVKGGGLKEGIEVFPRQDRLEDGELGNAIRAPIGVHRNPASERGVHFAMPRPLRNRFVHLDLEPDLDDWCRWAVRAQVRPEIIAFLRFKPELLHTADTTADANAWPTPRSWEMASHVLSGIGRRQKTQLLSGTSEFEAQLLDGTVGQAAASEFVAFLRLFRQLPSIDAILLNPGTASVPSEPSAQIAIATALGRVMSDSSVGRGLTYLDRMPTEMRVMAMRDAAARDTAITHTPEFVRFGVEYREVLR